MTEQAKSIILDAFEDIVAGMDENSMESADARTAIRALNRMMATLESRGIALGYTPIDSLSDEITVDDGALDPIISLLAYRLWPKYRTAPMPEILSANASQAVFTLSQIALDGADFTAAYPDILPIGSGNLDYTSSSYLFYSDLEDTILTGETEDEE